MLVSVNCDEVAVCRVDGDGRGAGVVHWDCAVDLQNNSVYCCHSSATAPNWNLPVFKKHLKFAQVVDMNLTACVSGCQPLTIFTGAQQVHRLFGACKRPTWGHLEESFHCGETLNMFTLLVSSKWNKSQNHQQLLFQRTRTTRNAAEAVLLQGLTFIEIFHLPLKWEFKTSDDTSIVQSYDKRYFIAVNAVENFQKAISYCCKVPSTFWGKLFLVVGQDF